MTDETYKQETFLTHARGVVSTVDIAVELLERNDTDTLITALRDLGAKHGTRGRQDGALRCILAG